ncbi:hypothetical protein AB0A73_21595 [Glycomyces sp. NPDC047369]
MDETEREQRAAERLAAAYGPQLPAAQADAIERSLAVGAPRRAMTDLAAALADHRVPLATGDATELHVLLAAAEALDVRDRLLFPAPPTDYGLYVLGASADAVAAAVAAEFGVPPEGVGVASGETYTGPDRAEVYLTAISGMVAEMSAGKDFADRTGGASELDVAAALCRRLSCRVVLSAVGLGPDDWVLVTPGGHGLVQVSEEANAEQWEFTCALELVPGASELPVRPPRLLWWVT